MFLKEKHKTRNSVRTYRQVGLAVMCSLLLLVVSCQGVPTSPETKESELLEPISSVEWKADGIVSSNEYAAQRVLSDNFVLYWNSDGENIYIAMKARTSGWVSIGFQPKPENKKKGADIVLGYVLDDKMFIYDLYSDGTNPHYPDVDLGGSNDIYTFGGTEGNGYTTIEFKRRLETDDKYDQKLQRGKNKIIWAWSSRDSLDIGHDERGYGEIDI
ncbi:MAG: DOMON domain-containing protein [Actinobacteria bacterium]|nr:DOMON domain-containing protein [Actinomycetota bacterium]